jgi:hypothetical protein
VVNVHDTKIRSKERESRGCLRRARMVFLARIEGGGRAVRLLRISCQCRPRVEEVLRAVRSPSERLATSLEGGEAATRHETSLSDLRRRRRCTLMEMSFLDPTI